MQPSHLVYTARSDELLISSVPVLPKPPTKMNISAEIFLTILVIASGLSPSARRQEEEEPRTAREEELYHRPAREP